MSKNNVSRLQLINEFESAPESTLFSQNTLAAVLDCSVQLLERKRWAGQGVPYLKIGRTVRYRKLDIINYLQHQCVHNPLQEAV
ncbi:DNA-binding protein [Legionella sp. CNM-4043-24]|uniref:DNA-binding protein n=1 Tax=Legionella sp. CNM-4043-24 TaxID=3421646 RepID=UPI00403AA400